MKEESSNQPIRVLHVVTYMGRGGLETMIMNYYRHIDRSKVQFDFLVHRDFKADYDDEITKLGGTIYRIPRLIPWSYKYRKSLNNFFKTHPEYKIIHVHQDCLSSIILKAAKKYNVPVRIAHSHSSNQDKNLKLLIKLYYRRKIKKFSTDLFACGKEAGDWMFCGEKYQVIHNAIDSGLYTYNEEQRRKVRKELNIPDDIFVIGHVGRFNIVKNHSFLLDIFSSLLKTKKESMLVLVGDGELSGKMERKAEELGIKEKVIFTGVRSDVADIMQAMDCFVFPSLYEGLPVTLIEAQAAGLPCVVSENVSDECNKTDLIERVSLDEPKNIWIKCILSKIGVIRQNTNEMIKMAGYDITFNAQQLQNFYLVKWKKEV